jgi:hypothetical protein
MVKSKNCFPSAPRPLGKTVDTTHVDANLYHDLLTGRAVTGIIHHLNGTIIDWYAHKQSTVETSTWMQVLCCPYRY